MRKFIIAVASLLALAIPAAGIASVAVDNGVGYVGRATCSPRSAGTTATSTRRLARSSSLPDAETVIADYKMSCFNEHDGCHRR